MERIKLNLIPSGVAPVVHLSQYDEGRKFGIDLFEGDSVYVLDGTETLTVNSRKPDGHVVVISVTNTGTSSLEVETVEQLTAVHGTSYAKLKIEKGSVTIATLEFLIAVSRDPLENGDPSESFVDNLNTQISNAVADQYDSNNVIFDNDPTTGHGIGYTVTSEGIKTAIDNAIGGLSIPDELNDLSDVDTTTPTQGEALVWDGTKWVNGTVSTVGNLDDLSDVDTTGKATGDSLRYIGGEWKAKPTTVEMTQAEYNSIVDFTPYENTHIVITDAPNLNATASDIEYSSGVSVADKLTSLASDKADKTENVTFTPASGVTVIGSSCGKVDKCVNLAMKIEATLTANTEKQLGTISNPPTDECVIPAVSSGAVFLGMVIIKANGNVSIYPTTGGTNLRTCFSVAYKTT